MLSSTRPREVDDLKWWKINRSIFFDLGKVARNKMLCSPQSSVEREHLHWWRYLHTTPQPNNAGDWGEIDASELQSADLQFQQQETKWKVTQSCNDFKIQIANVKKSISIKMITRVFIISF